jgi:hypothetical protein
MTKPDFESNAGWPCQSLESVSSLELLELKFSPFQVERGQPRFRGEPITVEVRCSNGILMQLSTIGGFSRQETVAPVEGRLSNTLKVLHPADRHSRQYLRAVQHYQAQNLPT